MAIHRWRDIKHRNVTKGRIIDAEVRARAPEVSDAGRLAKLPKWAQARIAFLEEELSCFAKLKKAAEALAREIVGPETL